MAKKGLGYNTPHVWGGVERRIEGNISSLSIKTSLSKFYAVHCCDTTGKWKHVGQDVGSKFQIFSKTPTEPPDPQSLKTPSAPKKKFQKP